MIVDVALVPDALAELSFERLARAAYGAQNRVTEALLAHGSLVFSSGSEIQDVLSFVKDSPVLRPDERKRWSELLMLLYKQRRLIELGMPSTQKLREVDRLDGLSSFLSHDEDHVIVLAEPQFDKIFPTNDAAMVVVNATNSIVVANTLADAGTLKMHRDRAEVGSHPHGYSREAVWAELFRPLARRSNEVVIFDRYLFGQLAKHDDRRSGRRSPEHLVWLLDAIKLAAPLGTRVKLYGGFGDANHSLVPITAEAVTELILRNWVSTPGKIVELEVHVANWASERRLPHGRHIRFDGLGYSLEEGFDRLREPNLWDEHGFHWKYMWRESSTQGMKDDEIYVAQASTATVNRTPI